MHAVPRVDAAGDAHPLSLRTCALYATWYHGMGPRWTVFGRVDPLDSAAREPANGYRQYGVRL